MANIRVQNIDLKVKEVPIFITVVPVTCQNICFNEIDGQNCSGVLADLTLCRAQGPKDCHMTNFENFQGIQHRFKLDSGVCSNKCKNCVKTL